MSLVVRIRFTLLERDVHVLVCAKLPPAIGSLGNCVVQSASPPTPPLTSISSWLRPTTLVLDTAVGGPLLLPTALPVLLPRGGRENLPGLLPRAAELKVLELVSPLEVTLGIDSPCVAFLCFCDSLCLTKSRSLPK